SAPQLLEEIFHGVGHPAERVEAHDGSRALERVRLAEDGVDQLGVVARLLQHEQVAGEGGQALLRLLREQRDELLVVAGRHRYPLIAQEATRAGTSSASASIRTARP